MRAVVAREAGGPEVLDFIELDDLRPGPGQLLVRVAAAGVNFIDTYRRSGVYPIAFPHTVGTEGSGEVVGLGDDVSGFAIGDLVSWDNAAGSYAEQALVPAANAVRLPEGTDLVTAAALPLQGMTAHYLVTSTFEVGPGHDVLLHAGAGGVGLLLTQLAVARGARVITTVGSAAKAELSRAAGASHVIDYSGLGDIATELPPLVKDLTGGAGVHVVYDGVGKSTFDASLASLRRRGMLVLFGGASGQVPPFDIQRLNAGGSLFLTRPTLAHHLATREELEWRMSDLLAAVADGSLKLRVGATFPLARAADAHRALEGRQTTGKVVLLP